MITRSRVRLTWKLICAIGLIAGLLILSTALFLNQQTKHVEEPYAFHKPTIEADTKGNIHIVWQAGTHGRHKIYYIKLDSTGQSKPKAISQTLDSYNPDLAIGSEGDIYVVWDSPSENAREIFFTRFADGSWTKPIPISSNLGVSEDSSVIVDGEGHVHVVWQGLRGENYQIFYREWDGRVWKEPKVVSESEKFLLKTAHHPAIAAEHETIHIVWQAVSSKPEIYYVRIKGSVMSNPINLSNNEGNSLWPRVSVDSYGNIHVVWRDDTSGNYEVYYSRGNNQGWSNPIDISGTPESSDRPDIAVDMQNNVHAVWSEHLPNISEIHYSRYDGRIWSRPTSISENLDYSSSPAITVDNAGRVHVVWESVDDGKSGIYYRMYDGEKWSDLKKISIDERDLKVPVEICQIATEDLSRSDRMYCISRTVHCSCGRSDLRILLNICDGPVTIESDAAIMASQRIVGWSSFEETLGIPWS